MITGVPIIHWLPLTEGGYISAELLTVENGEIIKNKGFIEKSQYPEGTIVQLERIGYAKIEKSNSDYQKLVFLHN